VPPDPALKCYLQGLNFGTITALRGNGHRSIVVISNYKFRPDDGGTMPGKGSSFTLPVEPISPPPKPAAAASWIAPSATGLGGGAGYRPRVRRAYFDTVYRHSRARRQIEYSTPARFSKWHFLPDALSVSNEGVMPSPPAESWRKSCSKPRPWQGACGRVSFTELGWEGTMPDPKIVRRARQAI
jgi:hypothetical protein